MKQFTGLVVSLTLPVAYAFGGEAPMLKKMVDAGKLPPLEERLPENPLVENPVTEVGKYGVVERRVKRVGGGWRIGGGLEASAGGFATRHPWLAMRSVR